MCEVQERVSIHRDGRAFARPANRGTHVNLLPCAGSPNTLWPRCGGQRRL